MKYHAKLARFLQFSFLELGVLTWPIFQWNEFNKAIFIRKSYEKLEVNYPTSASANLNRLVYIDYFISLGLMHSTFNFRNFLYVKFNSQS